MPAPTDDGISIFTTIEAFKGGLTDRLTPVAGADVADGWAAKIESADRSDLSGIAALLRQLAGALRADPFDGAAVGDLMKRVGAHTAEAAQTETEAHLRGPLDQLGTLVAGVGTQLSGGHRADEIVGVSTDLNTSETDG